MADEYAIAPNHNNAVGLVVVHTTAVGGKYFAHIQGVGTFDPGEERVYSDGSRDDVGEGLFAWLSTRMTWAQYEYVIATPLQTRRSNRVTVRTRRNGAAYANYNAILTLPKTSELTRVFGYYLDVVWRFTQVNAI